MIPDAALMVEEIPGERMRYRVRSATNPDLPYVVDLGENGGNGACRCKDFLCRRQKAINEGKPLFTRFTLCKHLLAARNHFTNTTLKAISQTLYP